MSTPWPPSPASPPPVRRGAPGWAIALLAAVTALVVGAGVFLTLTLLGGTASADEVTREPVNTAGANPFMPAVGQDAPDVAAPASTGGTFRGDTPGLYGGTRDNRTCDAAKLTGFLTSHPSQAAAWSEVLGISTSQITSYVSTLTPVLLRSDTAVTNHGYSEGRATVVSSVLQSGTAVFVDRYGSPVVRCACGNPLTAPTLVTAPVYVGPTWVSFNQTSITIVQNTTNVVNDYTIVDPWQNRPFTRTTGYKDGFQPKEPDGRYGDPLPPTSGPTSGSPSSGESSAMQPPNGTQGQQGQTGAQQVDPTQAATCPDGTPAGSNVAQTATADLTSDGMQDAAVLVKCGEQDQVQVIDATGAVLVTLTPEQVPNSPEAPQFRSISLSGTTLTATMDVFAADDTTAPTEQQTWTYTWNGSSFALAPGSVQAVEPATPTTTDSPESLAPDAGLSSVPPTTTETTTSSSDSSSTGG